MAKETQKPAAPAGANPETATTPSVAEEVAVEKPITEKEPPALPEKPEVEEVVAEVEKEKEKEKVKEEKEKHEEQEKIAQSASFKEESNVVGELPDPQKKALDELKQLIQDALNKHEFVHEPKKKAAAAAAAEEKKEEGKEKEKAPEPKEEKPSSSSVGEPKAEEEKEQPKAQETKPEEPKPEAEPEESKKPAEEPKTEEKLPVAETKEEEKTTPPPPPAAAATESVIVTEVLERTVEAIEETIVAAKTEAPEEPAPATEKAGGVAPAEEETKEADVPPLPPPEEVSIWGIPLLKDERSDTILLKFLRARDFKVKDAFTMIKNTVRWRKEFGIDALLEEDLGNELEKVVFMHGFDKEGHPVCYNVFGEFQNKELYQNAFADDEKRTKFLRWRIQFLEKSIRKLDFSPRGICTIVQVSDLKNSPGPAKRELRLATNQALQLLQDNYPEFVAKQVFINVPWWYLAFNRMISPFLTQRTKSKFVFAGPSKSAETLFRYIAPEQVPVQYGGLSREGDQEFTSAVPVTEVTIKPAARHTVEFSVSEISVLVWELRVLGWDVSYGAEFTPSAEGSYTVIVSKTRKIAPADEPVISDAFKIGEPGKVVLTIDNQSSKKKKLLYRSKTKPCSF